MVALDFSHWMCALRSAFLKVAQAAGDLSSSTILSGSFMYPAARQSVARPAISSRPAKQAFSGLPHASDTRLRNAAVQRRRSSISFRPSRRICTPATSSAARNG